MSAVELLAHAPVLGPALAAVVGPYLVYRVRMRKLRFYQHVLDNQGTHDAVSIIEALKPRYPEFRKPEDPSPHDEPDSADEHDKAGDRRGPTTGDDGGPSRGLPGSPDRGTRG